ncbi:heme-degrading domain-containing protein [Pseudoclavibacter sp. VKM Ac-2867]|uniref:heme-degrading domain-containing protein n=1 Tax=Pseudoclavibacter sp. VKM Ac-2867 TaxID=2783829 RepID=UPI00188C3098|nr:heme-degrading domain-containing protein [Pseudoclavibacter sp. VKM Ac-2867]MBF4459988.1 heme-degrading domain-containing protein [Pseudoclavibacter sp. VKM Ac-2867]
MPDAPVQEPVQVQERVQVRAQADDAAAVAAADLARIRAEEAELVFARFSREDAWRLGSRMREAAAARSLPVVIGIVVGQQRVFHAALDGAVPDNDAWLERKTRAVLHFEQSSLGVGALFRSLGRVYEQESRLDPDEVAANGGVFPVRIDGVGVVGAVGISGLPQVEDHAFVVEQLREFLAEA